MIEVFEQTIRVTAAHIDANRHVNNVQYVQWMQDIAVAHAEAAGVSRLVRELGATWVVRSHHIDYRRPAPDGAVIRVQTWVASVDGSRSVRKYRFSETADGRLLVLAATEWVYVDLNRGRPAPIPESVSRAFVVVPWEREPAD